MKLKMKGSPKSPVKTPSPKSPARGGLTTWSNDRVVKIVMLIALISLVAFSVMYIVNIQSSTKKLEAFNNNAPAARVVYVHSESCPHCVKFTPVFDEFAKKSSIPGVTFEKYEHRQEAAAGYLNYVAGFPTVLVFDSGSNLIDLQVGSADESRFAAFVTNAVATARYGPATQEEAPRMARGAGAMGAPLAAPLM